MTSPQRLGPHMTAALTSFRAGGRPIWRIFDKRGGQLGTVEWFARWKQYVLAPDLGTVFNDGCLREIVRFLGALNAEEKGVSDGR